MSSESTVITILRQSDEHVCSELESRYKMDKQMWIATQRKSFPFNLNLL